MRKIPNSFRLILFFIVALLIDHNEAHSYPSTIGHGYPSCLTCHFNPYGNGPLNDYGRALAVTTVANKPFWTDASDDELAQSSGFLGSQDKLPQWMRLSADFRGMLLMSNLSGNGKTRFIPMQLEGSFIGQIKPNKTFGVVTIGYAPDPASASATRAATITNWISREHYFAHRFKKVGLYVGMMDTVYGIRIPDHIAYHRYYTSLAQNDQTHGVMAHFVTKPWELGVHAFFGNFFQTSDLRMMGGSFKLDHRFGNEWSLGMSGLYAKNDYRQRIMLAMHTIAKFGKGSSIMSEIGLVRTVPVNNVEKTLASYIFVQPSVMLSRGLYLLTTLEYYTEGGFQTAPRSFRVTPGVQYFPMQRVELRVELQASRSIGQGVVNPDVMNFLGQIHLWF